MIIVFSRHNNEKNKYECICLKNALFGGQGKNRYPLFNKGNFPGSYNIVFFNQFPEVKSRWDISGFHRK